jgi:hypothetical protein
MLYSLYTMQINNLPWDMPDIGIKALVDCVSENSI